ncbi:hypothetical protein ACFL5Z_20505 [Planctomycetota bacterium]
MWLPKEERHLLIVYTIFDPNFDKSAMTFQIEDLQWVIAKHLKPRHVVKRASELREEKRNQNQKVSNSENTQISKNKKSVMSGNCQDNGDSVKKYLSWLNAKATIESVNNRLKERDLIESSEQGTGFYEVKMKLAGWDIGSKYISWWSRNYLWFREYKDHWIWIIVSFFGGVVGALFINWLSGGRRAE